MKNIGILGCRAMLIAVAAWGLLRGPAAAATAVGDWGHFLRYAPQVYLYNPDGRAFEVTVHLFRWPIPSWNRTEVTLRLSAPDGTAVLEGDFGFEGASRTFEVPAGEAGAYLLEMNLPAQHVFRGPDFWVASSLDRSVVYTGDPHATEIHGNALAGRWLVTQCSVPRRWWFWVPPGTKSFTARTQWIHSYQSQRENWGISILSPRGQRVRKLWGNLDMDRGRPFDTPESRTQSVVINVDPGSAGRFWSAEIRMGDAHNYSKISFSLEGVPPYAARSPEEWFDPSADAPLPSVPVYDDDGFMQFAMGEATKAAWPWLRNFMPSPSLGDPDGVQIRGDAAFALWNPEDRPLALRVGTYLPRPGADGSPPTARVRVLGAGGEVLQDGVETMLHLHGDRGAPEPIPATGEGVARVEVSDTERWLAFTYPATPMVLIGRESEGGWSSFDLEVGTVRNWYFHVPAGTRQFAVRAAVQHETDRLQLEIHAPDRTVAMFYGRSGEELVEVPPGLDGRIWHVRADVGSGSVMQTTGGPDSRYLHIYMTLGLHGVPGLLSPTWEQWFDPEKPVAALER